jgi:hypothetical protein
MSISEGGSAGEKARSLRQLAADTRAKADRIDAMASNWEAGEAGERRVAEALRPLEGPNCHVLHDRLLDPGRSRVNLDHIVVSVAGTYLIDAKNWSGSIAGSATGVTRTGDGRAWSRNEQVDKVRRLAEQMELAATMVIEPVLCLAGDEAAGFGAARMVRGVFVVPVDRLADWLTSRPRPASGDDLRSRTVRIAATFPSATQPAFLAIPPRRARRSAKNPAPRATDASARRRTNASSAGRSKPFRREEKAKAFLALAALAVLITPFGMRMVFAGVTGAASFAARHATSTLPTSAATSWTAPCSGVADAVAAKAVGHPVIRDQNGLHDACTWEYATGPTGVIRGNLKITTGWAVKYGYPKVSAAASYLRTTTSETLVVPQFGVVPGSSLPAAHTTQPVAVTISWASTEHEPAGTKQALALLVRETAAHLPQGTGSTTITLR